MLKTRVITAFVLLTVLLGGLFVLPETAWGALCLVILGAGAWEWGRLAGFSSGVRITFLAVLLAVGLALWWPMAAAGGAILSRGNPFHVTLLVASALFWLGVVPLWLSRKWRASPFSLALTGAIVLLPTWLALAGLRAYGPWTLLGIMAVVWLADSAAYFSGRRFGRRKLAPSISPGKTWEGAWGALLAVTLYGVGLVIWTRMSPVLIPGMWLLTLVSIEGDLFESLLKRQAGLKDSGNLLPGHGGVLDRIDALTSTLPLAALYGVILS